MTTYPADEQRIAEIERGRSCEAVLASPPGKALAVGEPVLFALGHTPAGAGPSYIKGGDSVLVSLTDVADLDATDPTSGQPLLRVRWKPLGQAAPPVATKRAAKLPRPHDPA